NQSITAGVTNNSAPSNVLTALRINSDHLPVVAKFSIKQSLPTIFDAANTNASFGGVNIRRMGDKYTIGFHSAHDIENMEIVVFNMLGIISHQTQKSVRSGENIWEFPDSQLKDGLNIISVSQRNSHFQFKIIK
ncbi:MAG: hypothetical protein K2Q22_17240, partial [Cytophagales bacterium]|nr:hypothetical protein [Cytophagales bacterium]